jgi:hypothetical protein
VVVADAPCRMIGTQRDRARPVRVRAPRRSALWLPDKACGFRILVVLTGFYGNARNQQCESKEADRYHVMITPPLVHGKGHAGPRDEQCHQDDHGICEV